MKRNYVLFAGSLFALTLAAAGAVYAWSGQSGDASGPLDSVRGSLQPQYRITDNSMSPTIHTGQVVAVRMDALRLVPGEIILFHMPQDPSSVLCRRVAAIAGDQVDMKYYANVKVTTVLSIGHPHGVIYPVGAQPSGNAYGDFRNTVPAGSVYVVSDNAAPGASSDSDEWGTLPVKDVIGIVASPDLR